MAVHPSGRSVAVAGPEAGVVGLSLTRADRSPRKLFDGEGRFSGLAWSPDGRWLLAAWRDADQWVFIGSPGARRGAPGARRVVTFSASRSSSTRGPTAPPGSRVWMAGAAVEPAQERWSPRPLRALFIAWMKNSPKHPALGA